MEQPEGWRFLPLDANVDENEDQVTLDDQPPLVGCPYSEMDDGIEVAMSDYVCRACSSSGLT